MQLKVPWVYKVEKDTIYYPPICKLNFLNFIKKGEKMNFHHHNKNIYSKI